jgi:competence protein ComEC
MMNRTLLSRLSMILLLVAAALGMVLLGNWLRGHRQPRAVPQAIVAYLDVGEGDCTLIRAPNGTTVLLDAGGEASAPHVISILHQFHVRTVDLLVLTDPGENSIGGVPALLAAFPVHQVWDGAQDSRTEVRRAVLESIRRHHVPSRAVHAGDNLQIGPLMFWKALWPPEHGPSAHQDALILEMDYGQTRFVFAGTAQAAAEAGLVADRGDDLGCTDQCSDLVLQVPRGGSDDGTSAELLRSAAPSVAVISEDGASDQPSETVLHRLQAAGAEVRRTDTMGTVIVLSDGNTAPRVMAEHL